MHATNVWIRLWYRAACCQQTAQYHSLIQTCCPLTNTMDTVEFIDEKRILIYSQKGKIEGKEMIRNRYNYPTPPIRDIKGKETQTRNNYTLMETSLAESKTDSFFPTKWPNGCPKEKDVSDTHIQWRTITKIYHDRRTPWNGQWKVFHWGGEGALKSILRGHSPRPYFCRGLDT